MLILTSPTAVAHYVIVGGIIHTVTAGSKATLEALSGLRTPIAHNLLSKPRRALRLRDKL